MATYGWRPVFVVLGFASLLWLVPWFYWMPKATPQLSESFARHRSARLFAAEHFGERRWGIFAVTIRCIS